MIGVSFMGLGNRERSNPTKRVAVRHDHFRIRWNVAYDIISMSISSATDTSNFATRDYAT